MKSVTRKLLFAVVSLALAGSASSALATTITFGEIPFPNLGQPTTEWASYGITMLDVYYYVDARDTFDGLGISIQKSPGKVFFTTPVNNLSIDWWVIQNNRGVYSVFDSADNQLDSFVASAREVDALGSYAFNGSNIARLEFEPAQGFIQVSTLRFDAVPEPGTVTLMLAGLSALGAFRRRR